MSLIKMQRTEIITRSCARHGLGHHIMKKTIMVAVIMVLTCTSMKAQYMGSGWGFAGDPGSPAWCWQQQQQINAMDYQLMLMQQQQIEYYRRQADNVTNWISNHPFEAYPGQVVNRDGFIITYELISSQRASGECSNCNGKGELFEKYYMGNNHIKTVRRRCGVCHGSGR